MPSARSKFAAKLVKKNPAVEAFLALLAKQRAAVVAGKLTNRSWTKPDGDKFVFRLGETDETYRLDSKDEVLTLIDAVAADAREDYDFIETLELAYGDTGAEPIKKQRRKRAARLDD